MKLEMIPCESCARHVRQHAVACPFCNAPQPERASSEAPIVRMRGTRAVVLAFGATVSLASCAASIRPADDSSTITSTTDARPDTAADTREDTSLAPPYGASPFDAGTEQ